GESGADRGQAEAERGAENAEQAPAGPPEGVVPDGPPASAEPGGARSIEGGNPIDRGDRE
ncbi:MAG: hypothetical protein ACRDL0_21825, partial [Thermoleophilaceae bacterium]